MMIQKILLFLIALILLSSSAFAQNPPGSIGVMIQVEGDGLITRAVEPTTPLPAKPDDQIYTNDLLQTGPGGRMLVLLLDDTRFTLGENSQLRISDYAFDDKNDSGNMARFNVPQGSFMYVSGLIAKKEKPDVKITTTYGTVSIRGTTVWGGSLNEDYGFYVVDGEAIIETNRGRIRVGKDEGTTIHNINSIPKRAGLWDAARIDWIKNTVAMKDADVLEKSIARNQQNRQALIDTHKEMIRMQRIKDIVQPGEKVREIKPVHQKPAPAAEKTPPKEEKQKEKKEEVKTITPEESNAAPPPMPEEKKTPDPL